MEFTTKTLKSSGNLGNILMEEKMMSIMVSTMAITVIMMEITSIMATTVTMVITETTPNIMVITDVKVIMAIMVTTAIITVMDTGEEEDTVPPKASPCLVESSLFAAAVRWQRERWAAKDV